MRCVIVAAAALVFVAGASGTAAGQGAPASDLYLAPLVMHDGKPVIGLPVDITKRPGYDNQPSFTPNSRSILFTSIRDDGQADVYRYDMATKRITRVTSTPESEYSPTVMPGGQRFSVVRVEPDSTQRLWSFRMDGSDPRLLLSNVKPVGYQAWIDSSTVALFLLGDRTHPNALVQADIRSGRTDTLARNIGRSLTTLFGRGGFSFLQRRADSTWGLSTVAAMRQGANPSIQLVDTLPRGAEFVTWITPTVPLTGVGGELFAWNPARDTWVEVADLSSAGIANISRLAVSPDGKWLAIVADDPK